MKKLKVIAFSTILCVGCLVAFSTKSNSANASVMEKYHIIACPPTCTGQACVIGPGISCQPGGPGCDCN